MRADVILALSAADMLLSIIDTVACDKCTRLLFLQRAARPALLMLLVHMRAFADTSRSEADCEAPRSTAG
jgi:hypothetical protein